MKGFIKFNSNPCDHGWSELVIHLTNKCDNKCPFCITNKDKDLGTIDIDVESICNTINMYKDRKPYVIISGGEPMLEMEKLEQIIDFVHENTECKVYAISSIPAVCIVKESLFYHIIEKLDGFIISAQHYDHDIADKIRGQYSVHNRNKVYKMIPYKDKVTISLNICKPYYTCKKDISHNIMYFYNLGYRHFKLVEIKDNPKYFIDIPKLLGIKVRSPFGYKCSPQYKLSELFPGLEGDIKLNLMCWMKCKEKKATVFDLIKAVLRPLFAKHGHVFGVIYEDGKIYPYWPQKNKEK